MHPTPQTKGWIKQTLIIVGLSSIFAIWMVTSILSETGNTKPSVPAQIQFSPEAQAASARRAEAEKALTAFASALQSRRYDLAWALMAEPYRARQDPGTFQKHCEQSALLSGLTGVAVFSTRERYAAGSQAGRPDSFSATGVLRSAAGNVELVAHMSWEADGPHVMTLLAAGVPLIQAVSP